MRVESKLNSTEDENIAFNIYYLIFQWNNENGDLKNECLKQDLNGFHLNATWELNQNFIRF